MKKKTDGYHVEMDLNMELCVNGRHMGFFMLEGDYKIKHQIINAAVDKVGLDKVKECMIDYFSPFSNVRLCEMFYDLLDHEKDLSKYMNISSTVLDRIHRKCIRLSCYFYHSKQFEQLKTRIIHDVKKCRTKDQMLEMFQMDIKAQMFIAFLRYCLWRKTW